MSTTPSKGRLSKVNVFVGKTRKSSFNRGGYSDEQGQVFLSPKKEKRVEAWRKKLEEQGYEVGPWGS